MDIEKREPEFPELRKRRELDRELHVKKSMEAGLSREDAERHADEHLSERDEGRR